MRNRWLKIHDADYRQAQQDFGSFVEKLTHKLIERDTTLPELPSKDIIFRIYRVRSTRIASLLLLIFFAA